MKIRLDTITVKDLIQLGQSSSPLVEVRIYVGEDSMITQRLVALIIAITTASH
jgi:hypothetical protein